MKYPRPMLRLTIPEETREIWKKLYAAGFTWGMHDLETALEHIDGYRTMKYITRRKDNGFLYYTNVLNQSTHTLTNSLRHFVAYCKAHPTNE